ncbi:iron-regulated protein FrpC, partial [Dokdonia ponticola]
VLPNPVLNTDVSDFIECSDDADFGIFDLTSKDIEITGGNPDYAVSYYASAADYLATPPIAIANPTLFNGAAGQEIFYSAENTITGCVTFDVANLSFLLEINLNPSTTPPTDLLVCDEDGTADELTTMDLTVKDIEVTGGFDPTVTVSYHLTLAGANADDASIPDPTAFTNTINPQIVFARVTNNITGCFSTEALRVEVFLVPTPVTPADLEVCDTDNDGIFDFFILSDTDAEITGGDTSLTVAYYLTQDDADNAPVGLEIDNMMYINVNDPFFQTIYARVFNAAGCFAVVPFNLVILNTPMPNETPDPYEICDDNADGVAVFDLTSQEPQILDGLDPTIFDVTWFVDQASVDANVAIPDPTAHSSNTTTVIAVVTDIAQSATTFCSAQVDLELIVNPLPTPVQPAFYELCDDLASGSDTDEFSLFDLRSRDDEIIAGNADWVVSYYLTEADADAGMPTLPDMYQNMIPASQTVWVRVENVVTGCYELITLTLVVNQLPSPTAIAAVE